MTACLRPLSPSVIPAVWVRVLKERVLQEMAYAQPGHCLRITDVPRAILEELASDLVNTGATDGEVYFVDRAPGSEPWRVGVHKVVERRNAEEAPVLALFPPDLQLAAGDSVDVSTFRVIPVDDLSRLVEASILTRIPESLRKPVSGVLDSLVHRKWPLTVSDRLTYLATVSSQHSDDPAVVGGALFALGLIPDFDLLNRPDELNHRLGHRNIRLVEHLRQDTTPLERVLRLPLTDEGYRSRLLAFLRPYGPQCVRNWGERAATDPDHRSFALDCWPLGRESEHEPGRLRIDIEPLKLPRRPEDGLLKYEAASRIVVAWTTTPRPLDVPGLEFFRIELVNSDRVVVWETPLIRRGTGTTARKSKTIPNLSSIDGGIYFFRVIGLNAAGEPFEQRIPRDPNVPNGKLVNESEDFLLVPAGSEDEDEDEGFEAVVNVSAHSYTDAEIQARWASLLAKKEPRTVRKSAVECATPLTANAETAVAHVRFDLQRQYTIRLSQRLRRIEVESIRNPDNGGHFFLPLGPQQTAADPRPISLPREFAAVRREVFRYLGSATGTDEATVAALADLGGSRDAIERYAEAYLEWLQSGDPAALQLDVTVAEMPEYGRAALVSPTHPLRLLWSLQELDLGRAWSEAAAEQNSSDRALLDRWRHTFSPVAIPPFLVLSAGEGFMDAGALPGGWGAYLSSRRSDSRAVLSLLRKRLGAGAAHSSEADVPPSVLADKLAMFLRQHPYTPALILNVVNPGDGALVLDALVDLEARRKATDPEVRYEVRLFTDTSHRESVGSAFRDLSDPDRQISEAAERLVSPGRSFLFPKLSWSRSRLTDFLNQPDDYPAHITILLDTFQVALEVERIKRRERTSFIHGLVQETARRFAGRGSTFRWVRRAAPAACHELAAAPERSRMIADLLATTGALQAQVLAPTTTSGALTTVVALDLSQSAQSLLYSAHAASTWVLTLDPNLGLDYFDSAGNADRPGYLLDFTPEFVATGGRQLLLTTRIGNEIARLMAPAVTQLGLDEDGPGALFLMEALRSLSGRLALRFLSAPSQVQGALGMVLARLFLDAYQLLPERIVIPLDAHPELVKTSDPLTPNMRGDLLLITVDPEARHLDFLVAEAKCHSGTGLPADLRATIKAQLGASETALREAFDPQLSGPDRIDRSVQSWRLSGVAEFYLERAIRYGLISEHAAESLRLFLADLDRGYTLSVRKIGLVFRLEASSTYEDRMDADVPIWVVGSDVIQQITQEGLRRYIQGQEASEPSPEGPVMEVPIRRTTLVNHPSWGDVRASFGGNRARSSDNIKDGSPSRPYDSSPLIPATPEAPETPVAPPQPTHPPTDPDKPAGATALGTSLTVGSTSGSVADEAPPSTAFALQAVNSNASVHQREADDHHQDSTPNDSNGPAYNVLLGDTRETPQYGLLGSIASEPWRRVALDLNGCNTISVFGVQGSGKSYTVGSILEAALQPFQGINKLPRPLGAVVFHYHPTQDYPPEFVSMNEPNEDPEQIRALVEWGSQANGLNDLLILTTSDTVELRRQEFPGVQVEPIAFASSELTVADWRFLMGATGNDALYLKVVNEAMRRSRADLTIHNIRLRLAEAPLSDAHRSLAETRLEFAAQFIDDSRSLRSLFLPGRLVVVDLRDEFIEREQALGLFVTMLNVFSGAGLGEEPFNKLIVFDEAHKYMTGGPLLTQVISVIREMRHKGVTAVVASQDPVNVPPAIIELSSAVILHRFNSPNWVKHIQRSVAALGDLTPSMLASLMPGDAFVWSNKATDPVFTRRAIKVRMRPRITKHGGSTRNAVD